METAEAIKQLHTANYLYQESEINHDELEAKQCEILESYVKEQHMEILNELIAIKEYMKEKNAFHGYGQMDDLIVRLQP